MTKSTVTKIFIGNGMDRQPPVPKVAPVARHGAGLVAGGEPG